MRGQRNPINRFFNDMKRRLFVELSLSSLALTAIAGCSSAEGRLRGKWQAINDGGEALEIFYEFLNSGTMIATIYSSASSSTYKIIDSDRMTWKSDKTGSTEIILYRFDGDELYLRGSSGGKESKHRRVS